jgi:hypothetical protein
MPSSGMWRRVDILLTDISEELVYSYLLTLVHRSWISYMLKMEAIRSSETSVNKISTRRHILEDGILHIKNMFTYATLPTFLVRLPRLFRNGDY